MAGASTIVAMVRMLAYDVEKTWQFQILLCGFKVVLTVWVEWKYYTTTDGVQCATVTGTTMMLRSYVVS